MTIDMTMTEGLTLAGRARDLVTPGHGEPVVVDEASFTMAIDYGHGQRIDSVSVSPAVPGVDTLVGRSAARGYRRELQRLAEEQRLVGRAIYQLLDDVPGAALVSGYSPQLNQRDAGFGSRPAARSDEAVSEHMTSMAGVCAGWQTGGVVLTGILEGNGVPIVVGPDAPSLALDDDPHAWHHPAGPIAHHGMRRARRIDVMPSPDGRAPATVDAMFRDSYVTDAGVETIVHEYTLEVEIDAGSGTVLRCAATPRALPFGQCPEAAGSAGRLVGQGLDDLRTRIRGEFVGATTCTHLNDMLRALADVGALAARSGATSGNLS
jgi:hypothetical protein